MAPERRTAGRAQQIGLGQGIAEHALEDGAAETQQRADQRSGKHARYPPFEQQSAAQIAVSPATAAPQVGRALPSRSRHRRPAPTQRRGLLRERARIFIGSAATGWKIAARCSMPSNCARARDQEFRATDDIRRARLFTARISLQPGRRSALQAPVRAGEQQHVGIRIDDRFGRHLRRSANDRTARSCPPASTMASPV